MHDEEGKEQCGAENTKKGGVYGSAFLTRLSLRLLVALRRPVERNARVSSVAPVLPAFDLWSRKSTYLPPGWVVA